MGLRSLSLSFAFIAAVMSYKPCPLLGPVFEAPSNLASCSVFQNALDDLQHSLDNATQTGTTAYGTWPATNNSFSIGIFDTTSPGQLFSYQYSSPVLQQSGQGVTKVTEDSIYRIGSLSKLITAYLFLVEAGPKYWNHPITDFIPELAAAAKKCSAASDPVNCIDWSEITVGAVASHMGGLPRDCEQHILGLQVFRTDLFRRFDSSRTSRPADPWS